MRDIKLKRKTCKERYDWYKDHGICTSCGQVWVEPGHVRCKVCEAKIKVYHDRDHEQRIQHKREIRQQRIEAGICTECGKRPAIEGMRMCARCRGMRNDSTRKWKIIQRIKREANKARKESANA